MRKDHTILTQQYLTLLYKMTPAEAPQPSKKTETAGEILYEGIEKILSHLTLSEKDSFIDLGSGTGRTTVQFFLTSPIKKAIGIEISPHLHRAALCAAERIQQDLPGFFYPDRQLSFLNEDVLKLTSIDASLVFVNSTCFSQALLYQICKLVECSQSVRTVLTTRPLCFNRRLLFKRTIDVECSWDAALCYVYQVG